MVGRASQPLTSLPDEGTRAEEQSKEVGSPDAPASGEASAAALRKTNMLRPGSRNVQICSTDSMDLELSPPQQSTCVTSFD
jgi:hypothetical protein